jgi:hypothetical protein
VTHVTLQTEKSIKEATKMNEAPMLRRMLALFFDLLISVSFFAGIFQLLEYLEIDVPIHSFFAGNFEIQIYAYLAFIGFYFIYEMLFTSLLQSTPGKVMVNAEVEFNRGMNFISLFLRSLIKSITIMLGPLLWVMSYIFAVARGGTSVVHDAAANSKVTNECRCPRLFGFLIFLVAFFVAYVFYNEYHLEIYDFKIEIPGLYQGLLY